MSSFCSAKATHIFSAKKIQHICISLYVNFNESLTNDIVSFEQLGPGWVYTYSSRYMGESTYFSYFSMKHMLWELSEALLSTHNKCFCGEIREMLVFFGCKEYITWSYDTDIQASTRQNLRTIRFVRPPKTRISLRIRAV